MTRETHPTRDGRLPARHVLFAAAALLLGVAAADRSAFAGEPPQVAIGREGDAYTVTAQFVVPHAPAVVLDVLTDYEGIPEFVPDVTRSVVRSRDGAAAVVEQEAVSRVMFFSKTVHLRLAVEESESGLRFRDELGTSFSRYEGRWQVDAGPDGGTLVRYELVAQPSFGVPAFLVRRLLGRDAGDMIEALRDEMAARAGQTPAGHAYVDAPGPAAASPR